MDTTYWSRRRVLTVLGAATAATSIPLAAPSRARRRRRLVRG